MPIHTRTRVPFACVTAVGLFLATSSHADDADPSPVGPDLLGFSIESMGQSADPREDFYLYAASGWLKRVERPERKPKYSIFTITPKMVQADSKAILACAAEEADSAPRSSPH